jgi:NTE family protein
VGKQKSNFIKKLMDVQSKSIGYALSGGGTKGIAHAGAIKFLEEQRIKPTHIAGSSAGAIVGALYSWGKTPDEILSFFKSIYFFHWKHFTLKKPGIIDPDSFKKYFIEIFGRCHYERFTHSVIRHSDRFSQRETQNICRFN